MRLTTDAIREPLARHTPPEKALASRTGDLADREFDKPHSSLSLIVRLPSPIATL